MRRFDASKEATRGATGGGVNLHMKNSWDISTTGRETWRDVEEALNTAMMAGLQQYVRRYPYALIAPIALSAVKDGRTAPLDADAIAAMPGATLQSLLRKTLRPGSINLQKYDADVGGYPYWHCELYPKLGDAASETLHRTLLWTIYLNDAFDAGETEFLYQSRKIVPRTGSLLLAPTSFTHTHRGNMPTRGAKYIATSWVLFRRAEQIYGQ